LNAICQIHLIASRQVCSEVHSWLNFIVHCQPFCLYIPNCYQWHSSSLDDFCSLVHSQNASKYPPSMLPSTPPSTFWNAVPAILFRMLSIALDGTLPAFLSRSSNVSSQDALKLTLKYALKYTAECTWWYTPSLLDYMLPSKLSRCSRVHSEYTPPIRRIYSSYWESPWVPERMCSVNLEGSISGENRTLGGHSSWPSEKLGSLMTGTVALWECVWYIGEHGGVPERTLDVFRVLPNQYRKHKQFLRFASVLSDGHSQDCRHDVALFEFTWAVNFDQWRIWCMDYSLFSLLNDTRYRLLQHWIDYRATIRNQRNSQVIQT